MAKRSEAMLRYYRQDYEAALRKLSKLDFAKLAADLGADPAGRLARCHAEWQAGDPDALTEAMFVCTFLKVSPPSWLADAVEDLVNRSIPRTRHRRQRGDSLHVARWRLVDRIKRQTGCSLEAAIAEAAEVSTGSTIAGSDSAFWKSYNRVKTASECG